MEWLKIYYPILSVGYIGLIITAAHLAAERNYSWTRNTISDLGAQGYSRRWIMRLGFIGFGLIMISGIAIKFAEGDLLYLIDIPILLYASAILLTGFFSTEPLEEGRQYSKVSDLLHSIFAVAAGASLSIALLMSALLTQSAALRWMHILFLVLITLASGLFGFRKKHNGIIQRVLYLVSFIWLIVLYNL